MAAKWTISEEQIKQMAQEAAGRQLEGFWAKCDSFDSLDMLGKKMGEKANLSPTIAKNMTLLADDIYISRQLNAKLLEIASAENVEEAIEKGLKESKKRRMHWESRLAIAGCDCRVRGDMTKGSVSEIHRASTEIRLEREAEHELELLLAPIKWGLTND
ncbi:hypothetical protein PF586_03370 [Lactobacillus delbrueckii]|uniref:Uncharacterized protein n=1 Tax=Lactobacillus delbrueckii TaxID=1584 RepID=A0AAW5YWK6_9LACO|nr:hypothetical protein [Lactobacillus delbrueckii]MDA3767528.1 hypothetical protein [Lactobacillus delbrueckii]